MRTRLLVSMLAIVAVSATLIGGSPQPATADTESPEAVETTTVDSADTKEWQYAGPWVHETVDASSHGSSESSSNTAGARATLQFFGDSIDVIGTKSLSGGRWRITLDCSKVVEGNSFAPSLQTKQVLASFSGLPNVLHTVVVEVLGAHDWPSTNDYVTLDAATVKAGPTQNGAMTPFIGTAAEEDSSPLTLRRPGCGAASSLLEALKARTKTGQFAVPGMNGWLGTINQHSLGEHLPITNPLTVAGTPREGASVALTNGDRMELALSLPDQPRTLQLTLAADELVGQPVQVAVVDEQGNFLPTVVVEPSGILTSHAGELVTLPVGAQFTVLADLRDDTGAGAHSKVRLLALPLSNDAAELTILGGRTSDVAFERLARQTISGTTPATIDPERLAAPASEFTVGPVALSRVIADADQPAWTGDQTTPATAESTAVPIRFGETPDDKPLAVDGKVLSADTISLQLPASTTGSSSVYLKFDTQQQCRALTASVGIDDSTANRSAASVSVGVYGDGEAMTMNHDGSWTRLARTGVADPVTNGFAREELATQLRDLKLAWAGKSGAKPETVSAVTALIKKEYQARAGMITDSSNATMTFPVPNPVTLGAGSTVSASAPTTFKEPRWVPSPIPGSPHMHYSVQAETTTTPVNAFGMVPLAADLVKARVKAMLVESATRPLAGAEQVESALPRIVHLVISGTPGAIVDLTDAELDCVSTQPGPDGSPAPRAMPTYSQLGVPPLFLPAPRDADSNVLKALATNPVWWDLACPNGPTTTGMQYTATRVRTTEYIQVTANHYWTVDTAKASKPACGFPADQLAENYSAYERTQTLGEPGPEQDDIYVDTKYIDGVKSQLDSMQKDWSLEHARWSDKVISWMSDLVQEVEDDPVTTMIWLALLPVDLPGAIVFNPITMHAVPTSAQVALGLLYLSPGAIEGAVRAIPAASRLGGSANEALMISAEQAKSLATLKLSDELTVGFHVIDGVADVGLADFAADAETVTKVKAPYDEEWFQKELLEREQKATTLCQRSTEMKCDIVGPAPTPTTGFWATYPDVAANIRTELLNYTDLDAPWTSSAGERVWKTMQAEMDKVVFDGLPPISTLLNRANVVAGEKKLSVALGISQEPAYIYSTRTPADVMQNGFTGNRARMASALQNQGWGLNSFSVNLARSPQTIDQTVYVAATRDPDLLASDLPALATGEAWYRYRIDRTNNFGGIDLRATFARAGVSSEVQAFANDTVVVGRADLLYTHIPGSRISHAHLLDYVGGEFMPIKTWVNPDYAQLTLENRELYGRLVPADRSQRVFDWYTPGNPGNLPTYTIGAPPPPVTEDGVSIFLKHINGWIEIPVPLGVAFEERELANAGFVAGSFGTNGRTVWIPTSRDGLFTVQIDAGETWTPHSPEP